MTTLLIHEKKRWPTQLQHVSSVSNERNLTFPVLE